jgi:predicted ATPase/serine/threonine protein kinase
MAQKLVDDSSRAAARSRFTPGGTLSHGRFVLCDKLGEGGMGVVYAASDQKTGSDIAIKTLLHLDPDSLYRFKNEFRALADVRHRNLIRLGELYCEDAAWFFTMERVHGRPFLAHVRSDADKTLRDAPPSSSLAVSMTTTRNLGPSPSHVSAPRTATTTELPAELAATTVTQGMVAHASGRFDEPRLREALRQLCLALSAVHESGHVHRDLKPSNVLVEPDGRLVLLDFGLVQELRSDGEERGIRGTPHYMAPEQATGELVGPPADWYALGVMLFEALTGVLPFAGRSREVLGAKLASAAPAPSTLVPTIPPDLDALCCALLARDPGRRPTGSEILHRLTTDASAPSAPVSAPFVGRAAELEELRVALRRLHNGVGDSILIAGEPGIGKTALARAFLKEAWGNDQRTVVLAGRCYDQENVPFKAFDLIIDALSDHLRKLPEPEAEALLAGGVYFLSMVFPVLRRVPAVTRVAPTSGLRVNPVELRAQAFEELKRLLAAIGRAAPLLIGIDDLQWADRDSLALLDELRRPPGVPRCLFVATMRATTDGAAHADASDEAIRSVATFRTLTLSGLLPPQAEALARAVRRTLGVPDGGDLAVLLDEARGHPLFISELARAAGGLQTAPSRRRLEDVLWSRIVGLDDHARRVLEFSALAGVPLHARVLSRAAGLLPNEAFHLFDELRAARLVRMQRASDTRIVEPYHDRIRESIVGHLGAAEDLEERHLLLGRALLAESDASELDAQLFAIVRHLNRAQKRIDSPQERIALAELNLRASRQAKVATAYDAALRYVDAGLGLLGDEAWRHDYTLVRDLFWQRVELEFLAGRHDEALAHFAWLYERLGSDRERVDLLILKIELDTAQRRFHEAIDTAFRGLGLCGVKLPRRVTPAALLAEYARTRWHQGSRKPEDLVALPLLADETKASAIKLLIALAPPAYFCDTPLLALAMMRIANISFRHGVSELSAYGIAGYGLVLTGALGRPAQGYALGQAAIRLDERFGQHVLSSKLHFVLGVFLTPWVRPFGEAQAIVRRGIELGRAHGDMIYEAYNAGKLCTVTLYEGRELGFTRAVIAQSRAITEQRRDVDMSMLCHVQDSFCAALERTASEGLFATLPQEIAPPDGISDQRTPIAIYFYYLLAAQLLHFAGDDERCLEFLAEVEKRKDFQFGIVSPVDMHLYRALAATRLWPSASTARRLTLARLIRRACAYLGRMERWNAASFAARARIARAARLCTQGRPMTALDELAAAVGAARQHGDRKHEAIALELMARLRHVDAASRDDAWAAAIAAYERWGALARAQQLHPSGPCGTRTSSSSITSA